MYKVSINETSYNIDFKSEGIYVDNELLSWDMAVVSDYMFHLITTSKSYVVEIVAKDAQTKHLQLKVNGVIFNIDVRDKYDMLLEQLGMQQSGDSNHREIRAPMPGMILDILVKEGQQVSKGDKLVILEAMKMENVIKSSGEGTVEMITIQKGMNVEKNQVLIQF
ncbi:MAG: acetyl-CoA carboxylase biotin carboxyl carrier protein subunit [Bacteroidetes bacterium]|nr:MAG: acetyl-CoA carboxylase biotin carboxyl carrier protein subunit [Bacteroidota bacterium]